MGMGSPAWSLRADTRTGILEPPAYAKYTTGVLAWNLVNGENGLFVRWWSESHFHNKIDSSKSEQGATFPVQEWLSPKRTYSQHQPCHGYDPQTK
jgi:hypothetical protein